MKTKSRPRGRNLLNKIRRYWKGRQETPPIHGRRGSIGFEPLESRLMLHGATIEPHDHDPAHDILDHIHAELSIFVDGTQVDIPADIGIGGSGALAHLHTHDTSGELHIEPLSSPAPTDHQTLGDFFDIWRTNAGDAGNNANATFSSTDLLGNMADGTHAVRMFVNSSPSTQFENYEIHDGDQIVLSFETTVDANAPTILPIEDLIVLGGSPLHIPLDGFDPNGQALTFTASSSNNSLVAPTVLSGNRSARITVQDFGDMVFELFEGRAERPTSRIIELAESGFYNGIIFHRVIDGFVLQGGDPTGTGSGGSTLGDFDDQFHVDLQHNTTGVLSYAKSTDDTNDSQFFITAGPTRSLDFNHSIFGQQVEGDNVRQLINDTPTNASDRPLTDVVIDSFEIFVDQENGVLMLKAPEGASGSADITVTVEDADGNTFSRTFNVAVQPDTANGGPFLEEIPTVHTTVNTPVVFQLSAIDVEGDDLFFDSEVRADVSINNDTGEVTVTPDTDFVGTLNIAVGVRPVASSDTGAGLDFDLQTMQVVVAPLAPTGIDLLASSDTGFSDSDNISQLTVFEFQIDGVIDGALIQVKANGTTIGQGTSNGTSVVITTAELSGTLGEGSRTYTATQILNGVESEASSSIVVTIDTIAPAANTSAPGGSATEADLYEYDAQNAEEGDAGFTYSLLTAPSGAAIDAASGLLSWTPTAAQVGQQAFEVGSTDAAGNTTIQMFNVDVEAAIPPLVAFEVEITDIGGTVITSIDVGDEFLVNVYVEDVQDNPQGVFSAYSDLFFNSPLATALGPITYGPQYGAAQTGSLAAQGIVDEAGAISGTTPLGGGQFLVFSVLFRADASGTAVFTTDPADDSPAHDVLVYNTTEAVNLDEISFGMAELDINISFGAIPDTFNFDEDTQDNSLDVLGNDTILPGSGTTLTIVGVGATNNGGTVTIASDNLSLIYTPAPDFNGAETFTYTITDGGDLTDTATILVQVQPVNDDPTANDDAITVNEDSADNFFDLLSNDLIDPDANETLEIISVGATSNGGTLSIGPNGTHVFYTPVANFIGTDTFSYTIDDGNGGQDTATVTVTVQEENDPPVANNDSFLPADGIDEDSADNPLDVLANDNLGPDVGETLTILSVSDISDGGTVTIANDNLSLIYTPAADFFGTETFTYTISDGNGGEDTALVAIDVNPLNDPPAANDDDFTVILSSGQQTLDVLNNDSILPDASETLAITGITQGSQGGLIEISSDGLSILYTPADQFVGTETFTYTIDDGNGETATATATVEVLEFVPSELSGFSYIDADNDGVFSSFERPLGGVIITLAGTNFRNEAVELTQTTNGDGFYEFTNLAPGDYTLTQTQPQFLLDGMETVGTQGGALPANDQISITLEEDTHGEDNNFAERGRLAEYINPLGLRASSNRQSILAAVDQPVGELWYSFSSSWRTFREAEIQWPNDLTLLDLKLTNGSGDPFSTQVDPSDPTLFTAFSGEANQRLVLFNGIAEDFNLTPVGSGEAEGEQISQALGASIASFPIATTSPAATTTNPGEQEAAPPTTAEGEFAAIANYLSESFQTPQISNQTTVTYHSSAVRDFSSPSADQNSQPLNYPLTTAATDSLFQSLGSDSSGALENDPLRIDQDEAAEETTQQLVDSVFSAEEDVIPATEADGNAAWEELLSGEEDDNYEESLDALLEEIFGGDLQ